MARIRYSRCAGKKSRWRWRRRRRRLYLNRRGLVGVAVSTDAPRKTRTRSRTERPDNPRDLFLPYVSSPLLRWCVGVQHTVPLASPRTPPRRTASPTRVSRGQKVGVKETIDTGKEGRKGWCGDPRRVRQRKRDTTGRDGAARRRASDGFRVHA